jgi:uncharacterized protein
MEIAGYLASIFIGIALGLMGGGGSILTVPVLVYLFSIDTILATSYSLFVVGATSAVGSFSYLKKGMIDTKATLVFGLPSIIGVFLTSTFLVPIIPAHIFTTQVFYLSKNHFLMLLFALLMLFAAFSMFKAEKAESLVMSKRQRFGNLKMTAVGVFTGMVTGLVGAGGGFLIIPALVNLLKIPIKTAIGTSLVIIAINSLAGFLFSMPHISVHWPFLISIAAIAILGVLIGSYISTKINGKRLKPIFGLFVLIMGVYIVAKETFLK